MTDLIAASPLHAHRHTRGFTLVEMAVVLLVVALILGSILVPLNAQVRQRNVAETERVLGETREALIGYAMIYGRLPQPAKSASDGSERDALDPASLCTDLQPTNCTGFVPWTALGTPRSDAWGKLIRYSVNPHYAGNGTGAAIAAAQFTVTAGERTVRSRAPDGSDFPLATNIPAVILSHGARSLGTTLEGAAIADSVDANADEDTNAAAGATTFWSRTASDSAGGTGGEFDDVVVWIPPAVLFSQLVAAGKLP